MTTNASVKFLNEPGLSCAELIEGARFEILEFQSAFIAPMRLT